MDGIIIEITEQNRHAEEASQIFANLDEQAGIAAKLCPDLSSLNFSQTDIAPETLAAMEVNGWNGVKYDRETKRLQVSGYRTSGAVIYWFYMSSKQVDQEPQDKIPVIIDGKEYAINI